MNDALGVWLNEPISHIDGLFIIGGVVVAFILSLMPK